MDEAILAAKNLSKAFIPRTAGEDSEKRVTAVSDVSVHVCEGKTLGIVGESGSGKTTLARMLAALVRPDAGEVRFEGRDVKRLSRREMGVFRKSVQMIFQDPLGSLNPRMRVGEIVKEPYRIHPELRGRDLDEEIDELLRSVGLSGELKDRFPSELSGGERQRVSIARALAVRPRLLVCDEAVSSLDVLVQAQILNLLLGLQRERGLAYIFISHDLRIVRHMSDDIAVMERGRVVEEGAAETVFSNPRHPYTQKLLDSANLNDLR